MPDVPVSADELISRLGLQPHPEGGHYAEVWRGPERDGRAIGTSIYFLLRAGERSHWHRVDATEIWFHHGGAAIELDVWVAGDVERTVVGLDVIAGQRPQGIVPAGSWQSARSTGEWSLVGCTVTPGFEFDGFELAPDGWEPPRA